MVIYAELVIHKVSGEVAPGAPHDTATDEGKRLRLLSEGEKTKPELPKSPGRRGSPGRRRRKQTGPAQRTRPEESACKVVLGDGSHHTSVGFWSEHIVFSRFGALLLGCLFSLLFIPVRVDWHARLL